MNKAKVAHVIAGRIVGIGDEHLWTGHDAADGRAELACRVRQLRPVEINFNQSPPDKNDENDQESPSYQTAVQFQIAARKEHERNTDGNTLVGHVGVEHHPRQSQIHGWPYDKQHKDQRMKLQNAVADRPDHADDRDGHDHECGDVGIVGDDKHQPVDFATLVPVDARNELHGRAGVKQRRHGEKWKTADGKIDNARRPRL